MRVNLKNYIDEGAISLDSAGSTRSCVCGNKILRGEKHLAIYKPQGQFSPKRYNFCKSCSCKLLIVATQRLYAFERKLFGGQGA